MQRRIAERGALPVPETTEWNGHGAAPPLPRPRGHSGSGAHRRTFDAVADLVTERFAGGHLCGLSVLQPQPPAQNTPTEVLAPVQVPEVAGPSSRTLARTLVAGGLLGFLVAVVSAAGGSIPFDVALSCDPAAGPGCAGGGDGVLPALVGVAGFAVVMAMGVVIGAGVVLPPRVGLGLQAVVSAGLVATHGRWLWDLYALGVVSSSGLATSVITSILFWYTSTHASTHGWLTVPLSSRRIVDAVVEHRRVIVSGWCLGLVVLTFLESTWGRQAAVEDGALGAVALICVATVGGAWLASRYASRMGLWLSLASAMMMVSALTDIIPDVWHDSDEAGTPLWIPALALAAGFLVVAFFTRQGCGHGHGDEGPDAAHGHEDDGGSGGGNDAASTTGRHQAATATPDRSAALGGVGAAAALTVHRVIEGATLALTPSVPVIAALLVHSASEGLALAALFQQSRRSMVPWLAISVAGPILGVAVAVISPLPETVVPVLLALVAGVLLRTALVGVKLAAPKYRSGELRTWHVVLAVGAACVLGVVTIAGH